MEHMEGKGEMLDTMNTDVTVSPKTIEPTHGL